MGRKKIKIANIANSRQKHITFMRRKAGIIKKCHELAILCNAKVMLAVWDEDSDCHVFATEPVDRLMQAYEAAYLGVGDRRLAEYEVEQVGEGSEDLVVKKVGSGQPFCRERYIPRLNGSMMMNPVSNSHSNSVFTPNAINGFMGYQPSGLNQNGSMASGQMFPELSPELFLPPSLTVMNNAINTGKKQKGSKHGNGVSFSPLPSPLTDDGADTGLGGFKGDLTRGLGVNSGLIDPTTVTMEAALCKALLDDEAFLRSILQTE